MTRTVEIRDIPDDTYLRLTQRAAESGVSVPDLLRREVEKIASRPSPREWLDRLARLGGPERGSEAVAALDDMRGPSPE